EAEVFQLQAEVVHAEAVGDRHVDVQRLPGDAAALVRRHGVQGAHVVQAVGELHQDHTDVLHHGEQHLAEVLRLRLGLGTELDLGELGNAVDQLGDLLAELLGNLVLYGGGVFENVVQDGGNERGLVHAHSREDAGDRDGMRDVRFAGEALLPLVRLGAEAVGAFDVLHLVFGQVGAHGIEQALDPRTLAARGAAEYGSGVVHAAAMMTYGEGRAR